MSPELESQVLDGRYRIDSLLDAGGMGVVYRARHLLLQRDVAIKLEGDAVRRDEELHLFMKEAQILSRLRHPNIVTVHDFARTREGRLYLVMELLEGRKLSEVLVAAPALEPDRLTLIAGQIALGLCEAHRNGIVHRDLKPDNVMVVADQSREQAKLLDFGLAVDGDSPASDFAGTYAYMSPEQFQRRPVTAKSDVFSFGILLFEMLTGAAPFEDVRTRLLSGVPFDLARLALLPPEHEHHGDLVGDCLAIDPADRPTSIQLVEALGAGRATRERPAVPAASLRPKRSDGRRRPNPGPGWRPGTTVLDRYVVDNVERTSSGSLVAYGHDTEGATVVLRRIALRGMDQLDVAEVVLERTFEVLSRFRHHQLLAHRHHVIGPDALLLVEDRPLGEQLDLVLSRDGPMPEERALEILLKLVECLEALHALQIAHLDIRPQHVYLVDGQPCLGRVGAWALQNAGIEVFGPEELLAARRWKAPEQLGAVPFKPGPESDVYALGALLQTMLTARPAFAAVSDVELRAAKLDATRSDALGRLSSVIDRATRPIPFERYLSTSAFRAGLLRATDLSDSSSTTPRLPQFDVPGKIHGRAAELGKLRAHLNSSKGSRPTTGIILGRPGVGKTRLANEMLLDAQARGAIVLRAKATPADQAVPFGVIRQMLADVAVRLDHLPPIQRANTMSRLRDALGTSGVLVKTFASFLHDLFSDLEPTEQALSADEQQHQLLEALVVVLRFCTDQPPWLLFDDLQWTDDATCRLLAHLAGDRDSSDTLLLVASRPLAPTHHAAACMERLLGQGALRVSLNGLNVDGVRAYVEERIGDPDGVLELGALIHSLSNGVPAVISGQLRQACDVRVIYPGIAGWMVDLNRVPQMQVADDLVKEMIDALPLVLRAPLAVAAVWGAPFDVGIIAELGPDLSRESAITALARGDELGIVAAAVEGWDFAHDTLREAARSLLSAADQQAVHRRAATMMAAALSDPPRELPSIAHHVVASRPALGDDELLLNAAQASLSAFDAASAARFARGAIERADSSSEPLVERARYLLGQSLARLGYPDEGCALLAKIADTSDDAAQRLNALGELGRAHLNAGRFRESKEAYERALSALDYRLPQNTLVLRVHVIWRVLREVIAPDPSRRAEWGRSASSALGLVSRLLTQKTFTMIFLRDRDALGSILDALYLGRRAGDSVAYGQALCHAAGIAVSIVGNVSVGSRLSARARIVAELANDTFVERYSRVIEDLVRLVQARFQDVLNSHREREVRVIGLQDAWVSSIYGTFVFEAAKEVGDVMTAARLSVYAPVLGEDENREWTEGWARQYGAWVLVQIGRPELGCEVIDSLLASGSTSRDGLLYGYVLTRASSVRHAVGDIEGALNFAQTFVDEAKVMRSARRHCATCVHELLMVLEEIALAERDASRSRELLDRLWPLARWSFKPFPCYRLHLLHHKTLRHRVHEEPRRLRTTLARAVDATEGASATVVAAEILASAAAFEGGTRTYKGRALLERAWTSLDGAHGLLRLKRRLSEELGKDPASEATRTAVVKELARCFPELEPRLLLKGEPPTS